MSKATLPVALSFSDFSVRILKPVNDGDFESVKNVRCSPTTAGLYRLVSRASLKVGLKPRTCTAPLILFERIDDDSISSPDKEEDR